MLNQKDSDALLTTYFHNKSVLRTSSSLSSGIVVLVDTVVAVVAGDTLVPLQKRRNLHNYTL